MLSPLLRTLVTGTGWRISDEICRAGKTDRPFKEEHSRFSVSAVLSGTFVYRSDGRRTLLSPGSLLIGRTGREFSCSHEHSHGDHCVAFYLDDSWVEEFVRELPGVISTRIQLTRIPPAQCLVSLIADVRVLADHGSFEAAEELVVRMAMAALTFPTIGPASADATPSDERKVAAALRLIEQQIDAPLSLSSLANAVSMSRFHFLRTFRCIVGQTPWRYIMSRRLTLAAWYLATESLTVLDAALAVGFMDLSEFTRRFRLHFGITPGAYRSYRFDSLRRSSRQQYKSIR